MDNSLASFAGQAFASSPVKPDSIISVSGVSLNINGPDYSVENLHNVPTQSITLALGQVALEMIALPSGLTVPAVLGDETVIADSNLVQSSVSVTTTLQSHEFGVLTALPSGVTVNTALGNASLIIDKTHEVTGVSTAIALGTGTISAGTTITQNTLSPIASAVGTGVAIADANITSTGVSAQTALGNEIVVINKTHEVTGVSVSTALGQVVAETAIPLTGLATTMTLGQETLLLNANVALTGVATTMSLGQVVAESRAFATQLSAATAVGQVLVETAIELPSFPMSVGLGAIAVFTWTDVDDTTDSGDTWTDVPGAPSNAWTPVDETTDSGDTWTPV